MTATTVLTPYQSFHDSYGSPLDAGYIYVGAPNLDPVSNPAPLYWDSALTITAAQPVRTIGGYPSRAGSPGVLYTSLETYSMQVRDRVGRTVYSAAEVETFSPVVDELRIDLADSANVAKGDALVAVKRTNAGATATTVHTWIERQPFNVLDYGATGDGVTDDWQALQTALDAAQDLGGGVVYFPPGLTYKIKGNTLVVWSSNIKLSGYGATLLLDCEGGGAGQYGGTVLVIGKKNGTYYYSPEFGGGYSNKRLYDGTNVPAKNVEIEGFQLTFGTSSEVAINGISGLNFENLIIRNCIVTNCPQSSYAFPVTDSDGLELKLENCLADGYGVQGFRFVSYKNAVRAGIMRILVSNCRSTNGPAAIDNALFPSGSGKIYTEVYGAPTGCHIYNNHGLARMDVLVQNCDFDSTTNIFGSNLYLTMHRTRMENIQGRVAGVTTDSGEQVVLLDGCSLTTFTTGVVAPFSSFTTLVTIAGGGGAVEHAPSSWELRGCSFATAGDNQVTIENRHSEMRMSDCTGPISYRHTTSETGTAYGARNISIERCTLTMPSAGSFLSFASRNLILNDNKITSPVTYHAVTTKAVRASGNWFVVNTTQFSSNVCLYASGTPVATISCVGNTVDWSASTALTTVRMCRSANASTLANTYVYSADAGVTLLYSYDVSRDTSASLTGTGYWIVGARIIDDTPGAGSAPALVCTVAGLATASTWKSEANLV